MKARCVPGRTAKLAANSSVGKAWVTRRTGSERGGLACAAEPSTTDGHSKSDAGSERYKSVTPAQHFTTEEDEEDEEGTEVVPLLAGVELSPLPENLELLIGWDVVDLNGLKYVGRFEEVRSPSTHHTIPARPPLPTLRIPYGTSDAISQQ
jgi:hypothetical protein